MFSVITRRRRFPDKSAAASDFNSRNLTEGPVGRTFHHRRKNILIIGRLTLKINIIIARLKLSLCLYSSMYAYYVLPHVYSCCRHTVICRR